MTFYLTAPPKKDAFKRLSSFFPEADPFCMEVAVMFRLFAAELERSTDRFLECHELLSGRFSILIQLLHHEETGLRAIDLAEKLGVTRGNMTALLDQLEKQGWVARSENPEDRRVWSVRLTPRGKEFIQKVGQDYFARMTGLMKSLRRKQKSDLLEILTLLRARLPQTICASTAKPRKKRRK